MKEQEAIGENNFLQSKAYRAVEVIVYYTATYLLIIYYFTYIVCMYYF